MMSQRAEYVLRGVVYLAARHGSPCPTHEIARATRVPKDYLAKLLQDLVRAGIVISIRGKGGGFILGKTPDQLTVFDVVQAVDPIRRINNCPLGLATHAPDLCPLHRRMDQTLELIERSMRESTLADFLPTPFRAVSARAKALSH